ncbi:phenylacrylic acid decarboxylase [Colletotrichum chrysophilum]|uniref:phenylacrylic acid decarboxylase n=1 Tax=Colletotrichum chrysophilum TaxID=1836956 RepID=UPI002301F527|nr:phenylacrylic acid decarboxylase [Colletotrichum chrysophilum]KAJ0370546.1 phenylacrylic acid decarboxylase [Colletotrichum chrysophilum]
MRDTYPRKKIIVAITGATGAQIGIHILQTLRRLNVETHLIISKWAAETIKYETDYTPSAVKALADHAYSAHDLAAPIASGSYRVDGMIVAPCSVKTLAAINAGICDDLITRAADVCLKERKRLVLSVRETPFSHVSHIQVFTKGQRAVLGIRKSGLGSMLRFRPFNVVDTLDPILTEHAGQIPN